MMHFWQEYYKNNAVSFSVHQKKIVHMLICLITGDVIKKNKLTFDKYRTVKQWPLSVYEDARYSE